MDNRSLEFELIHKYFQSQPQIRNDVAVGIGDDAAVVTPPPQTQIAVTTDTMVDGVHFDAHVSPRALGHKLVAVNLSDLAAMGAEPAWLSLALTLPEVDENWLEEFSKGLFEISEYYRCQLIGGDVTRGPLTLSLTAQGILPANRALSRRGASPGDWVYVTGKLGDAALALAGQQGKVTLSPAQQESVNKRLFYPVPQVMAGQALRSVASSAIDISDGLAGDLGHILAASGLAARINLEAIPRSSIFDEVFETPEAAASFLLAGGDDYELCFTIPENRKGVMQTVTSQTGVELTCIGQLEPGKGLRVYSEGKLLEDSFYSYSHFGQSNE